MGVTWDEIGTMYEWDRDGRVWVFQNDIRQPTPVLDISEEVGNWSDHGLLGFALHPNFRQNGYMYLLYVVDHHYLTKFGTPNYNPSANEYNQATIGRITRYTARASDNFHSVDPASRTVLLGESAGTGIPVLSYTHGVGTLLFGTDGTLLVSAGDGAELSDTGSNPSSYYAQGLSEGIIKPKEDVGAYRAQLIDSHSGKILRIDPLTGDGIPSNPFYDPANPRSPRSRVLSLGLRNPFRMTLRPETGSHDRADGNPGVLYIGVVGYFTWEKLSVGTGPARNFGWPIFEGLETTSTYDGTDAVNQDAPNPLFGVGGCTQRYFTFRDLFKEATLGTPSWPNPCNPLQQVPVSIPHFVHTRPAMDWQHGTGPSRVGIFTGNTPTVINIGAPGSPVPGPQFGGNCSVGGTWYEGADFPVQYQNTYFHADFGVGWIKNCSFDSSNQLVSVSDFASNAGGVVGIFTHPINGGLYYVDVYNGVRKISYGGNAPPKAVATADRNYGSSPLSVQFNGSGSSDPEGGPLTYRWNFGDGSAISTQVNPVHVFNAPAGIPTRYDVTLTVTDNASATNMASLVISPNNTPPSITITSPTDGTFYPITAQTVYNLSATVTDNEQTQAQMTPLWQVVLHHNNHTHPWASYTNWTTPTTLSPLGCDGDTYFYRITLTVTDAAGLSTSASVNLYPDCVETPPSISSVANQSTSEDTALGPIGFTVNDAETFPDNLLVSSSSSNPTLVPNGNITLGGSGANRTVTILPAANQSGTAVITLTVSDGRATASTSFNLNVTPVNDPPSISDIGNQTVAQNTSTGPISFTVGDLETAAGSLVVSGSSSNVTLVPNSNIVFGGSGANRTVTVAPANNQFGTVTITVTVSDGALTARDTFVLTVNSANNTAPSISAIANQTITQDTSTGPIAFTVGDAETAAGSLVVSGLSSNPTLVPNGNIVFGGSGSNRTVNISPALGQSGSAAITLTVSDGQATAFSSFNLVVSPSGGGATYLLSEDFEGTGFENTGWTKVGTPNVDYTNTVLHGLQSLNCTGGQQIYRTFAFSNSFYLYYKVRFVTLPTYQVLMDWRDVNLNTAIEM